MPAEVPAYLPYLLGSLNTVITGTWGGFSREAPLEGTLSQGYQGLGTCRAGAAEAHAYFPQFM